jgi:hypothetical protein
MEMHQTSLRKRPPEFAVSESLDRGTVAIYSVRSPATRSQKVSVDVSYNVIWNPRAFLDEIDKYYVARAPGSRECTDSWSGHETTASSRHAHDVVRPRTTLSTADSVAPTATRWACKPRSILAVRTPFPSSPPRKGGKGRKGGSEEVRREERGKELGR